MKKEPALLIRILKYCYEKEVFSLTGLRDSLELSEKEMNYVHKIRTDSKVAHQNEIIVLDSKTEGHGYMNYDYRLSVGATFLFLEFVELKEARESAKTAKTLSILAITIAIVIGSIPYIF